MLRISNDRHILLKSVCLWEATWVNDLLKWAPNKASTGPTHLSSKRRLRSFYTSVQSDQSHHYLHEEIMDPYPKWFQWWFWSDCTIVQDDLTLCWAHKSEGMFSDVAAPIPYRISQQNHNRIFREQTKKIYYKWQYNILSLSQIAQ